MMNKILILIISIFLVSSVFVVAAPNFSLASVNPSDGHAVVVIPEHVVQVAPGVFSLGTRVVDGKVVEGLMFVHYARNNNAKPPLAGGSPTCYAFLSKGAKWKTLENWIVNPSNTRNLDSNFVLNNLASNIGKWEGASLTNILGDGSSTNEVLVADTLNPDNRNEVYFADVGSPGAIAVTIVWGIFSGPPQLRELIEWDQVYDQVDFSWSSSGETGKMDFENIATHEIGHSVGMGHPESTCTEETMYAYADFGETKKRTLNSGDTKGIAELY